MLVVEGNISPSVKMGRMPIYEYRCANCQRKVSLFWRSFSAVDESKAQCTFCGSTRLTRVASRVRVIRGGGSNSQSESGGDMPAGGDVDDRMLDEMGGLDENDPRSLGRFMRKMAAESGESMGPEFDEIVGRLEKGEDPEKIEQSMGDMLDSPSGEGMMDDDMGMGMAPPAPPSPDEGAEADKPASSAKKTPQRAVRPKAMHPKSPRGTAGKSKAKTPARTRKAR
jgi:putative FmdB family regulatory protein